MALAGSSLGAQKQLELSQVFVSVPGAISVKAADFNHDGFDDYLAITSAGQFWVFYQNAATPGAFVSPVTYNYPTYSNGADAVSVSDLDANNYPDLMLGLGDSLCIYRNDAGVFTYVSSVYAGAGVTSIASGAFQPNGLPNIVVSSKNEDCLSVFFNQGNFDFAPTGLQVSHSGANNQVRLGDYNNDGSVDIVLLRGNSVTQTLVVFYQDGFGGFNQPLYYDQGEPANVFVIATLDPLAGDDLATSSGLQFGNLSFWPTNTLPSPPTLTAECTPNMVAMEAVDLDLDGNSEAIAVNEGINLLSTFYFTDPSMIIGVNSPCPTNVNDKDARDVLHYGDLNHDGKQDLILAVDSGIVILFNETTTGINEQNVQSTISVYPNPCQDELNIKGEGGALITIYSAFGQKVASFQAVGKTTRFDSRSLSPGVYTVISTNKGVKIMAKIIKL